LSSAFGLRVGAAATGLILVVCAMRLWMDVIALDDEIRRAKEKRMLSSAKFQLETVRRLDIRYRGGFPGERKKLESRLELIMGILEIDYKSRSNEEATALASVVRRFWDERIFTLPHYGNGGHFGNNEYPPHVRVDDAEIERLKEEISRVKKESNPDNW